MWVKSFGSFTPINRSPVYQFIYPIKEIKIRLFFSNSCADLLAKNGASSDEISVNECKPKVTLTIQLVDYWNTLYSSSFQRHAYGGGKRDMHIQDNFVNFFYHWELVV